MIMCHHLVNVGWKWMKWIISFLVAFFGLRVHIPVTLVYICALALVPKFATNYASTVCRTQSLFLLFHSQWFDFEANSIMILIIVSCLVYAHHTSGGDLWLRCKRFDVIRYAKCSAYGTLLRLQTLPFWHGFGFPTTSVILLGPKSEPFSGLKEQNPISKIQKHPSEISNGAATAIACWRVFGSVPRWSAWIRRALGHGFLPAVARFRFYTFVTAIAGTRHSVVDLNLK